MSQATTALSNLFNATPNLTAAYYYNLETGQTVSKNTATLITSASTYKLFIALFVIHQIETGKLSWNSAYPYSSGTVRSGFYDMIHISDNTFPQWIIAKYGKATIDTYLKSQGYKGIFNNSDHAMTSANDLGNILKYYNSHSSDSNVSYLLSLMKNQVYRSGIPAGTGQVVADKVGFLWDVRNDAGIVYDKHPYILVLMTNNQTNFDLICRISKQVQTIVG
ncbi:serine hydrolase [Lactococcus nasutitermitis]|uniref:Serine hydrolase n=1 Tax=Lactococcus nasutitermitis TaxID=1652957 RepID=A0ABV9JFG1_9LACT|nr:serine hydrolase [Lactococcus nasutitermitis]